VDQGSNTSITRALQSTEWLKIKQKYWIIRSTWTQDVKQRTRGINTTPMSSKRQTAWINKGSRLQENGIIHSWGKITFLILIFIFIVYWIKSVYIGIYILFGNLAPSNQYFWVSTQVRPTLPSLGPAMVTRWSTINVRYYLC
jgi:hypothetical protein